MKWKRRNTHAALAVAVLAGALLIPAAAFAQKEPLLGVRAGVDADASGPLVGAEVLTSMSHSWWFNPNLEYADGDVLKRMSASADFHYDLPSRRPTTVWLGGGPAMVVRDYDSRSVRNQTDLGLNLLAGVGLRTHSGPLPYAQAKVVLSDANYAELGVGVRF